MKTSPRICARKKRFVSREEAEAVAQRARVPLRAYKFELCHNHHLTSRTKGMRLPAFEVANRRQIRDLAGSNKACKRHVKR